MKKHPSYRIASIALLLSSYSVVGAAPILTFSGNSLRPMEIQPEKTTGLDMIYVLYDTKNVELLFPADAPSQVKVYKYSNLGGGYAEEVSDIDVKNDGVRLSNFEGNMGYIFEAGSNRYYYWIVNYLPYRFSLKGVSISSDTDCDATLLDVDGKGEPIHFFTINGQQKELGRDIKVTYDTQEFDSSKNEYKNVSTESIFSSFVNTIRISPAPLSYTSFNVSGDKFLEYWNWAEDCESSVIPPSSVSVFTSAYQEGFSSSADAPQMQEDQDNPDSDSTDDDAEGSNIIKGDDSSLGGSAPADISFEAFVSEGVVHNEWQLSSDPEFETVDYRFNVRQLDYTFLEEGTYYLRFIGSNADGSCSAFGDTYTVSIGSSELLCPNAFTPDDDGVNDIWKVSYRSLIKFDCWIFDRYGAELYHFSDPQAGWDGKRNGKLVNPGVYYYVITAEGADGKKYKKSGDINILRKRNISSSTEDNY